jgi:hypothetical protein
MSESTAWGLGIGLVVLGPFLNFVLLWLIAKWLMSYFPKRLSGNYSLSYLAAFVVLIGFHAVLVVPGMINFSKVCVSGGKPVVSDRVRVEAVYFDRLMEHEAESILRPAYAVDKTPRPFRIVEFKTHDRAKDIERYTLDEYGTINRSKVTLSGDGKPELIARYGVNKQHTDFGFTSSGFETSVYEIATNREIAKSANIMFHGGWLQFLRFMSGWSNCPDTGTKEWKVTYRLPEYVLGGYEPSD